MTVKLYRADGQIEIFKTENYVICKIKDFHPIICKVEVYTDSGKLIAKKKRHFIWYYKNFSFKTKEVQDKIEQLKKQNVQ